jgi:hypothetical protein
MAGGDLDDELRVFVVTHFRTIEQLEILLLLRSEPNRAFTAETAFDRIRSSLSSISERLRELCIAGFLDCQAGPPATFRYAPRTPELGQSLNKVADAYKTRRVSVVQAIYAQRDGGASEIARAFRFGKKKQ